MKFSETDETHLPELEGTTVDDWGEDS